MQKFKRHRDYGFFDQDIRLSKLTQLGDPLEKLNKHIDFEVFRTLLSDGFSKLAKGKGGRPPYDYVLMFKILILGRYYNLSDDQIEYQINDRMSFMRFLDLSIADDVPDSKTVWNFKEQLTGQELIKPLFDLFLKELEKLGLVVNEGKIVDASFVEAPRQRNSREDNAAIKEGAIPEDWKNNPNKLRQKDTDARWTKKNNVSYYGYKNHAKCDLKSKLITGYEVTDASVHDSQPVAGLLDKKDEHQPFYADSAYVGAELEKQLVEERKVIPMIIEKGYKNKPLTEEQQANNKGKSKVRVRVEHIFGFVENSMGGSVIRCIGIKRANATIGLMNLTYNMFRKIQLQAI